MFKEILKAGNIESEINDLLFSLSKEKRISVIGAVDEFNTFKIKALIAKENKYPAIFVVSDIDKIKEYEKFFAGSKVLSVYNPIEMIVFNSYEVSKEEIKLASVLNSLIEGDYDVLIVHISIFMQKLPSIENFSKNNLTVKLLDKIEISSLVKTLINLGYKKAELAKSEGEVSVKSDILDIFCFNSKNPTRLSFFDNEIESIYKIDNISYKKIEELNTLKLFSSRVFNYNNEEIDLLLKQIEGNLNNLSLEKSKALQEIIDEIKLAKSLNINNDVNLYLAGIDKNINSSILDYTDKTALYFDNTKQNYDNLKNTYSEFEYLYKNLLTEGKVIKEHINSYFSLNEIIEKFNNRSAVAYQSINVQNKLFSVNDVFSVSAAKCINFNKNFNFLAEEVKLNLTFGKTVILNYQTTAQKNMLIKALNNFDITFAKINSFNEINTKEKLYVIKSDINDGVELTKENIIIYGKNQIFGRRVNKEEETKKNY